MTSASKSFQDLLVWQRAMELVRQIYEVTALLPADERFNLVSQMRRAAVSIPSNIAEGHGRNSTGEFCQFLGIAMGSLREIQTCNALCGMLGYEVNGEDISLRCEEIAKMIHGLKKSLNCR